MGFINEESDVEDKNRWKKITSLTDFIPTSMEEISVFAKLYCKANFEIFFPFPLQWSAAARQAAWWCKYADIWVSKKIKKKLSFILGEDSGRSIEEWREEQLWESGYKQAQVENKTSHIKLEAVHGFKSQVLDFSEIFYVL